MASEFTFTFPLPHGLHARPASHLQAEASRFACDIRLHGGRAGRVADVKSVLSLIAADVQNGDQCRIVATGTNEAAAIAELKQFVEQRLPNIDAPLEEARHDDQASLPLPRSLLATGLSKFFRGKPVSPGLAIGPAVRFDVETDEACACDPAETPAQARQRLQSALRSVQSKIESQIRSTVGDTEHAILSAHLAIVNDPALHERLASQIDAGDSSVAAVRATRQFFTGQFRAGTSDYLRERANDVEDICRQLTQQLAPDSTAPATLALDRPAILVCDDLAPSQFLQLDRTKLLGLVISAGGATSHTVILARSAGVPTIVGAETSGIAGGSELIVDADLGLVIPGVDERLRRYYALEARRHAAIAARSAALRAQTPVTVDGRAIEIAANVMAAEEVAAAIDAGADGVGLFRTEMLFMDRPLPPSEQEQFEIYRRAAEAAGGKPLIVRLVDIGGDKPAAYLRLQREENPFLGFRGVRLFKSRPDLFLPQLRAILRASVAGNLKLLVPMVTTAEEIREVRAAVRALHEELNRQGIASAVPPLGIMLEVPSNAFLIEDFAKEVDFFSVGSNDLTQYLQAADRGNRQVADLYDWTHPAVLRALHSMARQAREQGKWIGLCGEMAADSAATPLLLAMGFDELSMSAPAITAIKQRIRTLSFADCRQKLNGALRSATRDEVRAALKVSLETKTPLPLLSPDCILLDLQAGSREEAIKQLADQLAIVGRTDDPKAIEAAIWAREDVYSTGFGHGFAVPHCQSEALHASSIVVAKLHEPVAWGGIDAQPVDIIFMLAIRSAEHGREHMKILAQLSRLMMREEFREAVRDEADSSKLLQFLQSQLFKPSVSAPAAAEPTPSEA